jgi:hypothetical protein
MAFVIPTDVTVGSVLTASRYNADVVENMTAIGGAWTSFTPTWTNLTVGNATQNSAYIAAGKLHIVRIALTWGSTTSMSGVPEFTLPNGVSFHSSYYSTAIVGYGALEDDNPGTDYTGVVMRSGATAARGRFLCEQVNATYAAAAGISATVPFTWATGDNIFAVFTFEAA